jgi:hypothetical protein
MSIHSRHAVWALAVALTIVAATSARAQMRYARGQNVAPAFEGWERNPDGTINMVFGYLNRNYEEEVNIPIGPNNRVDLGGDDRGQPTHFYPRRQRFVFKVAVSADWDKNRKVQWTLTSRGRTDVAKGWLQPEWELNPGVYSENNGGGVLEEGNRPPSVTGSTAQAFTIGSPATLTVSATDDGLPKPIQRPASSTATAAPGPAPGSPAPANVDANQRRRRAQGLRIRWIQYRGPGQVTFDPDSVPAVYGKPVELTTKASFSAPGTYLLRAIAGDGQLESIHEVSVTVNAGGSAQSR